MKLIVGTNNPKKLQEMQLALGNSEMTFISYQDYLTIQERPIEIGTTYEENASIKAFFYQKKLNLPVLGDDGGLEIEAFPDLLGIKTHTFFQSKNSEKQNQELLNLFTELNQPRTITLHTTLVYAINKEKKLVTQASLTGELVKSRGIGGYGFDSIIYVPKLHKTLAELTEKERFDLSPRIQALRCMIEKIQEELHD
ncbi:non-canonical purine NTP pyrophosphatase [Carnobacterium gallinarum]|uniref:non-canonical purine NTP pyrophosphatase n=1 Tax=Carnobacterium gallinarum TaxID=2749 RepID=UPI00054E92F0|nr:non-canonical purine NTP pyrophosphatase [Carnobacterium gallinarum]